MIRWAIILFIVAIIAGALGFSGVMAAATNIAYVLAVIAIVLFILHLVTGKKVG